MPVDRNNDRPDMPIAPPFPGRLTSVTFHNPRLVALGRLGLIYCESDVETATVENVIADLLDGQYSNPVRIIAFNAADGWSHDISAQVAAELRRRCDCSYATSHPAFRILWRGTKADRGNYPFAFSKHRLMTKLNIELPTAAARRFVKDMEAFFTESRAIKRDEIAARQLHALREHRRPRDPKLRLSDVKELFELTRDFVDGKRCR
jgi:hypothetical protein